MNLTPALAPENVVSTIQKHLIGDGFPLVFDLEKSHGSWIHDALTGDEYLDCYTFFGSLPLGFRHPAFFKPERLKKLRDLALHKPANSDSHTRELARFTEVFAEKAMVEPFRHLFFIEGGALAVENALKTAFDWKVRRNIAAGRGELGNRVVHFRRAFHGRSGYTLSLTNTVKVKTDYFPKFDWPRVSIPRLRFPLDGAELGRVKRAEEQAIGEIREAFKEFPNDVAAIIIEPIQGEGGDNHFRPKFLQTLRTLADEGDALLIFDEVQTGFGLTGKMWAFQHFGVTPDIVCFGKKAQVCGIMAGPRIDEVEDNVFAVSSRLNSTWGGNLGDMYRCEIILETMETENLVDHAAKVGRRLLAGLKELADRHPRSLTNPRGRGLMCAFDCPDGGHRDDFLEKAKKEKLLILPCGDRSIRFRPALTIERDEIDEALRRLKACL